MKVFYLSKPLIYRVQPKFAYHIPFCDVFGSPLFRFYKFHSARLHPLFTQVVFPLLQTDVSCLAGRHQQTPEHHPSGRKLIKVLETTNHVFSFSSKSTLVPRSRVQPSRHLLGIIGDISIVTSPVQLHFGDVTIDREVVLQLLLACHPSRSETKTKGRFVPAEK